jgi:Protein of unknown function (DUF3592)/Protein of unknown function (DUF1573)
MSADALAGEKKAAVTLLTCIGMGLGAIGVFLLALVTYRIVLVNNSTHYRMVQGIIEESEIQLRGRGGNSGPSRQKASIAYRYQVDGSSHVSRTISYADPDGQVSMGADEIIGLYPVGKAVPVYYNPENPADSVLRPSRFADFATLLCWGIGLVAVAACGIYHVRKIGRSPSSRSAPFDPGLRLKIVLLSVLAGHAQAACEWPDRVLHVQARMQDSFVQARYVVRNNGSSPVKILTVQPSCGCTIARVSADVIPPMGESFIEVTYDIGERSGENRATITVTTDDAVEPTIALQLTVDIPSPFSIDHKVLTWKQGSDAETKTVRITVAGDEVVHACTPSCIDKDITVVAELSDGGKTIVVTVRPGSTKSGKMVGVTLKTDHPIKEKAAPRIQCIIR